MRATCIVARELDPADGDKPIEWRLLTNLDLASLEQAAQMIDWYRARWEIEMFFHVLKNGCCIEALQLGSIEKIERALAHRPAHAPGAQLPGFGRPTGVRAL